MRDEWWLTVVGRNRQGVSMQQMASRLAAISSAVMRATVPPNWAAEYQKDYLGMKFVTKPAANGISWPWSLRDQFREPLTVLMAVVGMVLLIACANVAALLLARGAAQKREISVRLALGASRSRLVRNALIQSMMLAVAGAAGGLFLADWGAKILVAVLSTHREPVFLDLSPDWRIAAFTAAAAVLTACLFGMLPALRSTRVRLTDSMRSSPASHTERRNPLRKAIVAAQIALSLVLLIVAGLFLRSFEKLLTLNPGFNPDHVLLARCDLGATHISPEQQPAIVDQIQQQLADLPGVVAVGISNIVPLGGGAWNQVVHGDSPGFPREGEPESLMNFISPGYLAAMRIPLIEGRDFSAADTKSSPPAVIVNRAFARKFFGTNDPIGHVIRVNDVSGQAGPPIQVVGVVADAKYRSLRETMKPTCFFPLTQLPHADTHITFAIRTATPPQALIKPIEAAVASINHEVPLAFNTLKNQVDDDMVQERLLAILSAFFGTMALLLAMIGLYGTVSYQVTLRRAEFGIRMALGARVVSIVRLVLREVVAIVLIGVSAGIGISLAATTALSKLLFGIGARDAATMASAAALLGLVALLAALAPARRAAHADPMISLRCE